MNTDDICPNCCFEVCQCMQTVKVEEKDLKGSFFSLDVQTKNYGSSSKPEPCHAHGLHPKCPGLSNCHVAINAKQGRLDSGPGSECGCVNATKPVAEGTESSGVDFKVIFNVMDMMLKAGIEPDFVGAATLLAETSRGVYHLLELWRDSHLEAQRTLKDLHEALKDQVPAPYKPYKP